MMVGEFTPGELAIELIKVAPSKKARIMDAEMKYEKGKLHVHCEFYYSGRISKYTGLIECTKIQDMTMKTFYQFIWERCEARSQKEDQQRKEKEANE